MKILELDPNRWVTPLLLAGLAMLPAAAEGGGKAAGNKAAGGETAGKETGAEADEPIWQPAVYDGESISLLEAVRIALENSPAIEVEKESVRFQQGFLEEATGRFDATLVGNLELQYLRQEVRASERQRQQELRDNLQTRVDEGAEQLETTQAILDEVIRAQEDPTAPEISDPELQAQVDLINLEIERETDPTERARLIDVRDRGLAAARLALEEDVADLSMVLMEDSQDLLNLGATPEEEESYDGLLSLQVVKPFRSGLTLSPFLEYTVVGDRFVDKPSDVDFGGKGLKDLFRFRAGFAFDIPLLRGFGQASTGAEERAAGIDLEASLATLEHTAARNVLATLEAYWNLAAATQRAEVFGRSLEIQEELVELTEMLISADELPASELSRVKARAADARAALEGARRQAIDARFELARVIGLQVDEEHGAPEAGESFGIPPSQERLRQAEGAALVRTALDHRRDYRASLKLQESGGVLLEAARRDRRAILDLNASLDYNSAEETDFSKPLDGKYVGPSWNLGLNLVKPFANRTQKGRYTQALAEQRRRGITASDLERTIRSNVVLLLGSLEEALLQLETSQEAAKYAQESITSEQRRFRLGESILIDVLLTEQRLTEARLQETFARQQVSLLLARLRFETGTLFTDVDERRVVFSDALRTLPSPRAKEETAPPDNAGSADNSPAGAGEEEASR